MKNYGGGAAWNNKINKWTTYIQSTAQHMRNDGYNFHYSSLIKSITRYRSTYFIRVFFAREQSSCCVLFAWWHHKLFIWIECLTFIKHKAFTPHSIGSSPPPITRSPFNLLFQVSYFIHVDVHLYSLPAFKKSILHPSLTRSDEKLSTTFPNVTLHFPIQ